MRRSTAQLTVLFTSVGRRVELIECFRRDAATLRRRLRVVATELSPELSPACRFVDRAHAVPPVTDPDYVDTLLALCHDEGVDLLIPLLDPELPLLAESRRRFDRIGTRVVVSSPETVALCRDKLATMRHLARHGIQVPRTAAFSELVADPSDWRWPVIAKPVAGSGSRGIHFLPDGDALRALTVDAAAYLAQEVVDGPEYTTNLFCDRRGRLRCAVPHRRLEVRAGEVSKGRTERVAALMDLARALAKSLPGARGPLCFQARIDPAGTARVFEINARFGGGFPLAHHAGARFPLWLMQEHLGVSPQWIGDGWQDGVTMLRYDQSVFV